MLKTKGNTIVDSGDRQVFLRGVNLGAWLMMEGYILYGRNISENAFKLEMLKRYARKGLDGFTEAYRNNFIKESDLENISHMGFNCIRLPFNHKLIENQDRKFSINKDGLGLLKKAVSWCAKYGIYCILDMHAAPGSQNQDWHSDSDGQELLWTDKKCQERYFRLWETLAADFKDNKAVAGYNILNEPVIKENGKDVLMPFYQEAVRRIKTIDKDHIIFLEGNIWSQRLEDIGEPFADNLSYSVHYYHPLDFTFNFQKGLKYPGRINNEDWGLERIRKDLEKYYKYSTKWDVPVFVGEFGVNSRCPACYGEDKWLKDVLECFREFRFHWTYWTYKAVSNSVFPDGLYQYNQNPPWIRREGPVYGWENLYTLWGSCKEDIVRSWDTGNFEQNSGLLNLLHEASVYTDYHR